MTTPASSGHGQRIGYYRWIICGLLFLAATVNYVDRQVIGILKPTLQQEFGWSEMDYADIVFAFQLAYAVGLILAGRLMDRLGTRIGFTIAIVVWSVAAMAHAEATWFGPGVAALLGVFGLAYSGSVAGFMAARFVLGLGESGNFPASIKAVAEWFPKKERALATGIFNSGTNVGALLSPLAVPWITLNYGWYWAFVATGFIGVFWVLLWWPMYRHPDEHPRLSPTELAYIQSDPPDPPGRVPLRDILPHRQTWAFAIAKFMTDPIWWLYLFWVPDFLNRNHGIDLKHIGPPLIAIYLIADVGSIGGGWLSSALHQARLEHQRGAQDGHADVRARGGAHHLRLENEQPVGGHPAGGPGGRRAPGLVGERLHARVGHVPPPRRRYGRGVRRDGRRRRRHVDRQADRVHPRDDGQLPAGVPDRRLDLSPGACGRAPADAEAGAGLADAAYVKAMRVPRARHHWS